MTVFVDVDTQIDFLFPAGALYVPGAETILPAISRLNHWAASRGIPVLSTVDSHAEDDPEFLHWPAHCVAHTFGQGKPASTLLDPPARQVVFEKQTLNCFDQPGLREILSELAADRCVVYGVVTEICVRFAALGLLELGARVELVTDAVMHLDPESRDRFLAEFQDRGGALASLAQVVL